METDVELLTRAMNARDFDSPSRQDKLAFSQILSLVREWQTTCSMVLRRVEKVHQGLRHEFRPDATAIAELRQMLHQTDEVYSNRWLRMLSIRERWFNRVKPGLTSWSDKIECRALMIHQLGSDEYLVPSILERRLSPDEDPDTVLEELREASVTALEDHPEGLILKPSHSCRSRGLVRIRDQDNCITTHDNGLQVEGQLKDVDLPSALTRNDGPPGCAPLALQHASPGALLQPCVTHILEVRVVCVFGMPVTAIATAPPDSTGTEYVYDMKAHKEGFGALRDALGAKTWNHCADIAARVACGTDLLRVDLFISSNARVLVNEVEYVWQYVTARGWFGWIAADQIATIWARCWLKAVEQGTQLATTLPEPAESEDQAADENSRQFSQLFGQPGYTKLEVDGDAVVFDSVGPLVVGEDGGLSRISNWSVMNEQERASAFRLLGKRNKARLAKLRQIQRNANSLDTITNETTADQEATDVSEATDQPLLALPFS